MEGFMTGVENAHIAIKNGLTYEIPEFLSYSAEISVVPTVASGSKYGDNAARATQSKVVKYTVTVNLTNLSLEKKAKILGKTYQNGQTLTTNSEKAPFLAFGFNFTKDNNAKRYVWLYNGKFQENEESGQSEDENINFQDVSLIGEFIVREDNNFKYTLDTDAAGYDQTKADNWYKAVQEYNADTTDPTISSSVPVDEATGIAVDSVITITFDKAMNINTMGNVLLVNASLGNIDSTIALSEDYKTLTITPKANLAVATAHHVIVSGVMDTAGNTLPYTTIDFTTA